jgi:hypothetical protein
MHVTSIFWIYCLYVQCIIISLLNNCNWHEISDSCERINIIQGWWMRSWGSEETRSIYFHFIFFTRKSKFYKIYRHTLFVVESSLCLTVFLSWDIPCIYTVRLQTSCDLVYYYRQFILFIRGMYHYFFT